MSINSVVEAQKWRLNNLYSQPVMETGESLWHITIKIY